MLRPRTISPAAPRRGTVVVMVAISMIALLGLVALSLDGGTLLVYEAAWARAEGRDVARLAPMAKLFACQTFRDVTAMAQQIFGGVGFTLEYDIQLYFRRAKQLQISWWNDRELEERIAATILD